MRSRKKEENNTQKQNRNSQSQTKAREERERGKEGKRNSQRGSRAELKRRAMRRHVVIFRKKSPQPWLPPVPCAHKANDESWRSWRKQASVDASSNSSWSSSDSSSSSGSKSRLAKRAALISSRNSNSNNNISKAHSCCCCCNCCCCCCCYCDRLTTRLADILAARSHSKAERARECEERAPDGEQAYY